MTDLHLAPGGKFARPADWPWSWIVIAAIPLGLLLFDRAQLHPTLTFAAAAFGNTLPFILFAVLAVAYLKASGTESLLARAFGRQASGPVLGLVWPIAIPLQLVGPILAAWVRDTTGSYRMAFGIFAGALAVAVVLVRLVRLPAAEPGSAAA